MTSVSFNFSGSGVGPDGESFSEPDRFGHSTYTNDLTDLNRVVTALETGALVSGLEPVQTYGLLGHSRGGGTAVLHAARNPAIRALVTWSGIARARRWDDDSIARWREQGKTDIVNARTGEVLTLYMDVLEDLDRRGSELDILRAAGEIAADWLVVHAADDESVSVDEARDLCAASRGGSARLLVIPEGGHTFGVRHPWSGSTPQFDAVIEATIGWFSDHLF
jgi:pimeloyl-ACP methyl ester carboxylesterase